MSSPDSFEETPYAARIERHEKKRAALDSAIADIKRFATAELAKIPTIGNNATEEEIYNKMKQLMSDGRTTSEVVIKSVTKLLMTGAYPRNYPREEVQAEIAANIRTPSPTPSRGSDKSKGSGTTASDISATADYARTIRGKHFTGNEAVVASIVFDKVPRLLTDHYDTLIALTVRKMKTQQPPRPPAGTTGDDAVRWILAEKHDYVNEAVQAYQAAVKETDGAKGSGTQLGNTGANYSGVMNLDSLPGGSGRTTR
ncbi:hypothetical protein B0T24DRAFT_615804 [Lasiosphaeria ovina]|uniref:Uncharacterized protein n=1 Tax=Lasiosphaeria ovina TaxID=92902 RepID=A0AAE0TUU1_9PEZI|nr:hypothetical protein B0T24DRAFT_615804 [Lasiosphaeria ovina]